MKNKEDYWLARAAELLEVFENVDVFVSGNLSRAKPQKIQSEKDYHGNS